MQPLPLTDRSHVLVLTGAGASAESGIPTFRDADGLWESHRVEDVASVAGFLRDPQLVWRFYSERRAGVRGAEPNNGHRALADLEQQLGERMLLVTQNVDGLHQRAGSQRVVELHGNLMMTRCMSCDRTPFADADLYLDRIPMCGDCHKRSHAGLLRPHIVWFGERLDPGVLARIERFIAAAGTNLLFLAVGTSGFVYPAAALVDTVRSVGGTSWLVNLDMADNATRFDHVVRGRSGEQLGALLSQ